MNYYCKIVYKDKIEPTEYFKDKAINEIKAEIDKILELFLEEQTISGIYIGKNL